MNFEVIKRDERKEPFSLYKLEKVINFVSEGLNIDLDLFLQNFQFTFKNKISTKEIQSNLINTANQLTYNNNQVNPDFSRMANRLFLLDFWKEFKYNRESEYNTLTDDFGFFKKSTDWITHLQKYVDEGVYDERILISKDILKKLYVAIKRFNQEFEDYPYQHFLWNNFYYQTLKFKKSYLIKYNSKEIENFEEALLLISIMGFLPDYRKDKNLFIDNVLKFYKHLILYNFIPATPQLLNLRRKNGNLSSCNVFDVNDNLESIMYSITQSALISKNAGGIGIYAGKLRPSGSYLKGNKGLTNHINSWLKFYNDVAITTTQSGLRKGAITVGIPIWHKDVLEFVNSKSPLGEQRLKLYDLFPQVIIPNVFVNYLNQQKDWYLVDLYEIQRRYPEIDLVNKKGKELEEEYNKVVNIIEKDSVITNYIKIKPHKLLAEVFKNIVSSGLPYIFFEDNVNNYSNFKEKIYSGNLCVAPDTKILTKEYGYVKIKDVAGKILHLWNGNEWSLSPIFKTGDNYDKWYDIFLIEENKLLSFYNHRKGRYEFDKLTDKDLIKIRATDYHRWYVRLYNDEDIFMSKELLRKEPIEERTKDLRYLLEFKANHQYHYIRFKTPEGRIKKYIVFYKEKLENFVSDSYCFYEPKLNRGVLNGVLTGNCMESFSPFHNTNPESKLPSDCINEEELGYIHSCNLFSLNLPALYENNILFDNNKLKEVMQLVIRYMDNIIDMSTPPIAEIKKHNELYRTIGIGFLGLADLIVKVSIDRNKLYSYRFSTRNEGDKSNILSLIKEVFGRISFYSMYSSVELAKEKNTFIKFDKTKWKDGVLLGRFDINEKDLYKEFDVSEEEFEEFKDKFNKYGIRDSMLLNCPPNTSTSIYAGTTASIFPPYNLFTMESQKNATFFTFPKYVENVLLYDIYSQYNLTDMKDMIEIVSEIQKYIDSGISFEYPININVIGKEDLPEYMYSIFNYANKKNIKTLYYGRPVVKDNSSNDKEDCVACAN